MEVWGWILKNWFIILSAIGIIGSLLYDADARRSETKTQQITNLLTITTNHREIWMKFFDRNDLARVLDPAANLAIRPITRAEEIFVNVVILHSSSVYYARKDKLLIKPEGLRRDIAGFLSLPIPRNIWEKTKPLQNDEFVEYVNECLDIAKSP